MSEVVHVVFGGTAQREVALFDAALRADVAMGDVARILSRIEAAGAERHDLHRLSSCLLGLRSLVADEPGGETALDRLFEAARRFIHAGALGSSLAADRHQELKRAYMQFRACVAAACERHTPASVSR